MAAAADERDGSTGPAATAASSIEIEVETGLGRGGARPADVVGMAERIAASDVASLVGVWTHLQASDDAAITARQLKRFDAVSDALGAAGHTTPSRHVAASGGLLTGVAGYGGVRPGLSIYGIVPDELEGRDLRDPGRDGFRPVMSLHARPVRVADLPAGHGVSYGPTFTTSRPSRIATLPLGYGDGYARAQRESCRGARPRAARPGRRQRHDGRADGRRDRRSRDRRSGRDDEFVLLGAQGSERITAEDLARLRTTNTWEVVTAMSGRLARVYHAAAGAKSLRTLTRVERVVGTHRAVERRHLRPRGRRDRQPREPVPVDVDRRVRRDQASGR